MWYLRFYLTLVCVKPDGFCLVPASFPVVWKPQQYPGALARFTQTEGEITPGLWERSLLGQGPACQVTEKGSCGKSMAALREPENKGRLRYRKRLDLQLVLIWILWYVEQPVGARTGLGHLGSILTGSLCAEQSVQHPFQKALWCAQLC